MLKNGVETLLGDRNALEKEKTFAFFAARRTDATIKGIEKNNGKAEQLVGKDKIATRLIIFLLFSLLPAQLEPLPPAPPSPHRSPPSTDSRYIPCQRFAGAPGH